MQELLVDRDVWNRLKALGYIPENSGNRVELPEFGVIVITSDFIPDSVWKGLKDGTTTIQPRR